MSIEQLKKILESERDKLALDHYEEFTKKDIEAQLKGNLAIEKRFGSFCYGHEAATNRLLPLLKKAVEMANFYSSWVNMQDGIVPPGDCETMFVYEPLDKDKNGVTVGGKKAREFLSEFTKMTEIKKESV